MCRCVSPWTRWLTVDSVLCRPQVLSPQCSSMAYISQHTAHWVGIRRGWTQTSTEALRTGSSAIFYQCFWWHCWFQLLNSNSKKKVYPHSAILTKNLATVTIELALFQSSQHPILSLTIKRQVTYKVLFTCYVFWTNWILLGSLTKFELGQRGDTANVESVLISAFAFWQAICE